FTRVFAGAAGEFGAAAAFTAEQRGDGLDDFAGLNLFGEVGGDARDQRNGAVGGAGEDDYAFEFAFESIDDGLEVIAVGVVEVLDKGAGFADGFGLGGKTARGFGGLFLLEGF